MMAAISRNFDLDQSRNLPVRSTYETCDSSPFGEAGTDIATVTIDVG
jgi:hypothetical protein